MSQDTKASPAPTTSTRHEVHNDHDAHLELTLMKDSHVAQQDLSAWLTHNDKRTQQ